MRQIVLALVAGGLAALGQAPYEIWPATVAGLGLAMVLFSNAERARRAAFIGWLAGTTYFAVALSWIVEPFLVDAARHGWIAPFALFFLSAGLALFWALSFGLSHRFKGGLMILSALFLLAELVRGYLWTGFPWAQIGHAWINTPMLYWASWGGAMALTALMFVAAAGLAHLASRLWLSGGALLLGVGAMYAAGHVLTPVIAVSDDAPNIRLIQPNAAQHEKWDPSKLRLFFDRQVGFTAEPGQGDTRPDLVVWPETAIPVPLDVAEGALATIAQAAAGAPVVLGAQRRDGNRYYNALAMLDGQGALADVYDKFHLVPFGEYVPYGDYLSQFGIRGLASRNGFGYSAGPGPAIIDVPGIGRALPLICYEGVFPQHIRNAPERADFILLITNDAWFGERSGPYQHLAQARLRSAEQGLPMIRVANTGISAIIDATGRVTEHLPLGEAGWVDASLPQPLPETMYSKTGDGPLAGIVLILLGLSRLYNRRRLRQS